MFCKGRNKGGRGRESARERESEREGIINKGGGRFFVHFYFLLSTLVMARCVACMTNEITRKVHVYVCARTYAHDFMNR